MSNQLASKQASQTRRTLQSKTGLLMFLAVWLADCPAAVAHFLHGEEYLTWLTAQLGRAGKFAYS